MDQMHAALNILLLGLLKVFAVLATIFVGIKFIHWFVPAGEMTAGKARSASAAARSALAPPTAGPPMGMAAQPSALTEEEINAVRIALHNATGGTGTMGRILEIK